MTTLQKIKNGETFTLTNLTQSDLTKLGWNFDEGEETGNYHLDCLNGKLRLVGNDDQNNSYIVESGVDRMGGEEQVNKLISTGGDFDNIVSWVNGQLKYHSQKPLI